MDDLYVSHPLRFRTEITDHTFNGRHLLTYIVTFTIIASIIYLVRSNRKSNDGLWNANKRFSWEPAFFARFRWITNAQKIMNDADVKSQGRTYRLSRGDIDLIILPPAMIPELNSLGMDVLNSREYHATGLLGHLTGMDVVRKTSFHVRVLLSYISPALPTLFSLAGARISAGIGNEFPQGYEWTKVYLNKGIVRCISEAIALTLYGAEMTASNPELVRLTHEHTNNVFKVCFAMRCVPRPLQPFLVWLLPARWRLVSGWRKLRNYVVPRVLQLKEAYSYNDSKRSTTVNPDVISSMVKDGRNEMERDPIVLTTLVGSIAAGSTYSITNFCCRTIADMVAHPNVLDAVRSEIQEKQDQVHGKWDMETLATLEKLESTMKESSRLAPGSLLVYSRVVKKDHMLSNGLQLKEGQFVTISGAARTMDPTLFKNPHQYEGLRFCAEDKTGESRTRPFSEIDNNILTWGAGRWSCPGRLITDMAAKILLIKLLHEYEFSFIDDQPLTRSAMHEFLYFHPEDQMLMRRREDISEISFV
ncbi:cytochrome P450 [Annulohypoxylon maeteangense]|uniref:cytochrome P450 n=1 Tax=Annulohypoxylon maeteangense TaxID=1927788 RepID=UPI00200828ED|nr:cytochrome P450 [Annulohypoxylon maeteangense]KAI0883801.1 cytochrome P450 [Annulohypoxylon maeteangense]